MNSEKKFIIFTDLKDFTYKNALLTDSQIAEILTKFHEVVQKSSDTHRIKNIKAIGDAYFLLTDSFSDAYNFSQEIL